MSTTPSAADCLLVFVDVQNDYCHPGGALGKAGHDLSGIDPAVDRCLAILESARQAGVPVVHVRTEHSVWTDTPDWLDRGSGGTALAPRQSPIVAAGSWGAEPYRLPSREDELVLMKHRYSAFTHTPLELVARARGRKTLLLGGFTTDVCVRATAIDAQTHGLQPWLLADATSTTGASSQAEACKLFAAFHGPVLRVEELQRAWA
jgi:ureidoacrylate peracid hydrolase